ncbi:dialkylrecorsinol condensing enzyme DarA [Maribacter sp. 2210JD10-5]|uniref:dialkylrecorsinol condensing enzyme DarA n=1 Tax=Maribacter sp. 2210JD10-5 TaxID=3386272 RepID=UPI0039BCB3C1
MKEVLVIYYSQTGQLLTILENVAKNIHGSDVNVSYYEIIPEPNYSFPWKKKEFLDCFPESFLQIPSNFKAPSESILNKKYDLILLGHQVWYLTPSIPLNSFLKSKYAATLLKDTPVITVIGARNMWIMAQEKVKKLLQHCGAKLVGNIALVDRHINHISVITIVHWMMRGKKDKMWGIFPKPGVSDEDIVAAERFGLPIKNALLSQNYSNLQSEIVQLGGVKINSFLVLADKRANILFSKWANLIIKKGPPGDPKRSKWITMFNYYLLFAIWVIAPIVFIVFLLTYLPSYNIRKKQRTYYSSVAFNNE